MKRFQSYEDFTQALNQEQVPDIDIDRIKQLSIWNPSIRKRYGAIKKAALAAVAALLVLCVGTVAFASDTIIKKWQLFNSKGEVLLEYKEKGLPDEEAEKMKAASLDCEKIVEMIRPQLQKGEGAIIATPETNKFVQFEEYVEDLELLKQKSDVPFKTPTKLPEGYVFVNGRLLFDYDVPNDEMQEKVALMIKSAKESKEGYVVEKVRLSEHVLDIDLNYSNGTNSIKIYISEGGDITSRSRAEYNTDVLRIGERDVLHNWSHDQNSGVYFVVDESNDQKWMYVMYITGSVTKDELTSLIESMEF